MLPTTSLLIRKATVYRTSSLGVACTSGQWYTPYFKLMNRIREMFWSPIPRFKQRLDRICRGRQYQRRYSCFHYAVYYPTCCRSHKTPTSCRGSRFFKPTLHWKWLLTTKTTPYKWNLSVIFKESRFCITH